MTNVLHYSELHARYVEKIAEDAEILARTGELPGLRFGFRAVDDFTYGLREEDLLILAGGPGAGKTSVAMALLRQFAMRELHAQEPVGALFVSLEMGEEATGTRWAQMIASLTTRELRGSPTSDTVRKLDKAWTIEDDLKIWIMFGGSMTNDDLKEKIAQGIAKHNIKLVVLDHFRKVRVDGRLSDNAADEARVTFVKSLCKELKLSVILIAHTTKGHEGRDDKKPRLSDLSGSQMISAEADFVTFIYRPWEYLTDNERIDPNCPWKREDAYFVWRKNRSEKNTDSPFIFDGSTMRIEDPQGYGLPPTTMPRPTSNVQSLDTYVSGEVF